MCGSELTRRDVLAAAVGAAAATVFAGRPEAAGAAPAAAAVEVTPGLAVLPRSAWGADLPPVGPIATEDPLFLLVHHTQSPNTYPAGGARAVIRSVYEFHTGPEKRWPDVCYQFFVDHDGGVWEGRAGALDGPVAADATAGSQGWAQLACLIGDFTAVRPTPAARNALVRLLAWLAQRYGVDTRPGATVSFVSRGSNRWPAGMPVTAPTICGHRDMTYTECPGDAFYPDVRDRLPADVHAYRLANPLPAVQADPGGLVPAGRDGRRFHPDR